MSFLRLLLRWLGWLTVSLVGLAILEFAILVWIHHQPPNDFKLFNQLSSPDGDYDLNFSVGNPPLPFGDSVGTCLPDFSELSGL